MGEGGNDRVSDQGSLTPGVAGELRDEELAEAGTTRESIFIFFDLLVASPETAGEGSNEVDAIGNSLPPWLRSLAGDAGWRKSSGFVGPILPWVDSRAVRVGSMVREGGERG